MIGIEIVVNADFYNSQYFFLTIFCFCSIINAVFIERMYCSKEFYKYFLIIQIYYFAYNINRGFIWVLFKLPINIQNREYAILLRSFNFMIIFEEIPTDLIKEKEVRGDLECDNENTNTEYCFKNSLIDFNESNGYFDDEKTIFAYTKKRRFYM
ncbi:hypothetical protein [Ruminococcus sp. 210702-SL.1.03]|uniref:hypothetical protein n=1 Tax=Ruminococcus sp. 210702-SL.1.03 TaxID=2883233 RepID=UPI001D063FE6|nr:hypothetical protein [Ruminococcus sp. 210702-SL.1.03]MCB6615586.1 hypothetical protein [Ruminococcus sp. 210702-SL.1.03]